MNISEISIGDKVRAREWDDMMEEFGPFATGIDTDCAFTFEMEKHCGKEFVVEGMEEDKTFTLSGATHVDRGHSLISYFNPESLILVEKA